MSVWLWILLGIVSVFAVSLLVGLFVAAILANIGREFSALIELEPPDSAPLSDEVAGAVAEHPVRLSSSG